MQTTVLGSTPNGTFCICAGLLSSASVSRLASSAARFSRSRAAFSASLRFCCALELASSWAIVFLATAPFLFFMPKVLSSTAFLTSAFLAGAFSFFFGAMLGNCVILNRRYNPWDKYTGRLGNLDGGGDGRAFGCCRGFVSKAKLQIPGGALAKAGFRW